jgi:DNA mismatch repair protein PMS2
MENSARPLELSAVDELIAHEHVDVLRQNGFELEADEADEISVDVDAAHADDHANDHDTTGVRRGLRLVAQPISKNTVFDMHGTRSSPEVESDEADLQARRPRGAHSPPPGRRSGGWHCAMREGPRDVRKPRMPSERYGRHATHTRTDDYCAQHCCSFMTPSDLRTQVVRHMSTMDQPWNCPHGRPTMRHLLDLSMLPPSERPTRAPVEWAALIIEAE